MQLGKAIRHTSKDIRVGTHEPVVKLVCEQLTISCVIEDGMGKSSTPLFHKLNIPVIFSFEQRQEWSKCRDCLNGTTLTHKITIGEVNKEFLSQTQINFDETLAFVDGFSATTRLEAFKLISEFLPVAIVEHDADAYSEEEILARQNKDYNIFQFVGQNPETLLYVRKDKSLVLDENYIKL